MNIGSFVATPPGAVIVHVNPDHVCFIEDAYWRHTDDDGEPIGDELNRGTCLHFVNGESKCVREDVSRVRDLLDW